MPRIVFVDPSGGRTQLDVPPGKTILEIAWDNGIDIEGACGGCMACSTCHVIVEPAQFGRLPAPSEEEEDLLDLAWGLTPTSRLGCQVVLTEDLDGLVVALPAEFNNQLEA